jgi:flagellar biosynthetic protein FliR
MQVLRVGSAMFSTGFRLALPVIAVLTMVDISLALLGRVNAQLQLLTIAFPVKMIVALMLLGWLALLLPVLFRAGAGPAFVAARGLLAR